jgi:hypothetical protein
MIYPPVVRRDFADDAVGRSEAREPAFHVEAAGLVTNSGNPLEIAGYDLGTVSLTKR